MCHCPIKKYQLKKVIIKIQQSGAISVVEEILEIEITLEIFTLAIV